MTTDAGRDTAFGVATRDDLLASLQECFAHGGCRGIVRKGKLLRREVVSDLAQVRVREVVEKIVHRWVVATTAPEGEELVVEIPRRLAGEPWEIRVVRAFTTGSVAWGTCLHTCAHIRCVLSVRDTRQAAHSGHKTDDVSPL
jgi:hypothetical protein